MKPCNACLKIDHCDDELKSHCSQFCLYMLEKDNKNDNFFIKYFNKLRKKYIPCINTRNVNIDTTNVLILFVLFISVLPFSG